MKYHIITTKMDHTAKYIVGVEDGKTIEDDYEVISGLDWVHNEYGQEEVVSTVEATDKQIADAVKHTGFAGKSAKEIKEMAPVADSGIK